MSYFVLKISILSIHKPTFFHTLVHLAFRIVSWIRVLCGNFWVAKNGILSVVLKIMYFQPVTLLCKLRRAKYTLCLKEWHEAAVIYIILRVLRLAYSCVFVLVYICFTKIIIRRMSLFLFNPKVTRHLLFYF